MTILERRTRTSVVACVLESSQGSLLLGLVSVVSNMWRRTDMYQCTDMYEMKAKLRAFGIAISLAQIQETEALVSWLESLLIKFYWYQIYSHRVIKPCCHSETDKEHFSVCLLFCFKLALNCTIGVHKLAINSNFPEFFWGGLKVQNLNA